MRSLHIAQNRPKTRLTSGNVSLSPSLNATPGHSQRYENFPQLQNFTTEVWYLNSLIPKKYNNGPRLFEDLTYYNFDKSKSNVSNLYDMQKSDLLLKEIYQKLTQLINYSETLQNKINEAELKNKNLENLINELKSKTHVQTEKCVNSEETQIRSLMKDILMEYDADKIGLADYALESSGGSVISVEAKPTSIGAPAVTFLGLNLWTILPNPRVILQSNMEPGNCFAFDGNSAKFNIQLVTTIFISAITMEHIPSSIAIDISSAPKDFSIMGLAGDNLIDLGTYSYTTNFPRQTFKVQSEGAQYPYQQIQLQIHSNHGNKFYTCLYRIRVHGEPLGKL